MKNNKRKLVGDGRGKYKEWATKNCRKERGKYMKVVDEEREDRNSDGKTAWMGIRDGPNSHEWVTFAQERVAWKERRGSEETPNVT